MEHRASLLAEHDVYYRYTVIGYVKDAKGKSRTRVQVEVVQERTGFSYLGETEATGPSNRGGLPCGCPAPK